MNRVVDFGAMFKRLARTGNAKIMTSLAGSRRSAAKRSPPWAAKRFSQASL